MDIILVLIALGLAYLLIGIAVAVLYVAPWLKTLSREALRNILGGVEELKFDTPQDLKVARYTYIISIIPVWPVTAYRVVTYGRHLPKD